MLPHAEDGPALGAEQAIYSTIPGPVALDLPSPKRRPGFGLGRVPGAAVPDLSAVGRAEAEAAVYKYRGLALGFMVRQLVRSGESHPNRSRIEGLVWGVDY